MKSRKKRNRARRPHPRGYSYLLDDGPGKEIIVIQDDKEEQKRMAMGQYTMNRSTELLLRRRARAKSN